MYHPRSEELPALNARKSRSRQRALWAAVRPPDSTGVGLDVDEIAVSGQFPVT
jgi:hypothetical protein